MTRKRSLVQLQYLPPFDKLMAGQARAWTDKSAGECPEPVEGQKGSTASVILNLIQDSMSLRPNRILRLLRSILVSLLISSAATAGTASGPPNILLIMVDDLNTYVGSLGHPNALTPNMDRLAAGGTLFEDAHCQAPICGPSRASLMSGLRPSTTGIYGHIEDNAIRGSSEAMEGIQFLPEYLRANGYHTMGIGKLFHEHVPEGTLDESGGRVPGFGPKPADGKYFKWKGEGTSTDWGAFPETDEQMPDYESAQWAIERLGQDFGQPFFLGVGFLRPHVPWYVPQKWFDLYEAGDMVTPPYRPDDFDDIPAIASRIDDLPMMPTTRWAIENNEWQNIIEAYLACVSFVDHYVGDILEALEQGPHARNTIVILVSDHGYRLGEKGTFAKNCLWEEGTRVPLIFNGPGIRPGQTIGEPVELLDLYPTILDLAGLKPNPANEGKSLTPALRGEPMPEDSTAIVTYGRNNHSVISPGWHYIRYEDGSEELYDRNQDPHAFRNVAGDPAFSGIKAALKERLPQQNRLWAPASSTAWPEYLVRQREAQMSGEVTLSQERPNILWLVSEDNSPFLGCYGDPYAVTPNLDALAAQGVLYTRAFATAPVCAPARFTLATGLYPNTAGTEGMRSKNPIPDGIGFLSGYLRQDGYYCSNNAKEDYNTIKPENSWDESSNTASWRNRAPGQPFFHVQNFAVTHESRLHQDSVAELHDPARAPVPSYHPDIPEVRNDWAVYYDRVTELDQQIGDFLKQLEEDGLTEDTIVFYYSDHGGALARSKRFLFESGLRVPLIVHFPEKWSHLAPVLPGGETEQIVTFADLAPTVLSLAGLEPPDHMQGQAFLGQFAAAPRQYATSLRGRMDERIDRSRTIRDGRYRYTRNWMPHRPYGQFIEYLWRAPTTRAWEAAYREGRVTPEQSVFFDPVKPAEELYDCLNDPDNTRNLASDPAYHAVRDRLRAALDEWILEVRDSGLLPEGELNLRIRELDTTGYKYVRSAAYPIADLLHAANLASTATGEDLAELMKLSRHRDSGVRYWVATAYAHLDKDCAETRKMLRRLLDDPSPDVSIAAAEALYRRGAMDGLENALGRALQHPEEMVRVHACNALSFMEPDFSGAFRPLLELLAADKVEGSGYDMRAAEHLLEQFSRTAN